MTKKIRNTIMDVGKKYAPRIANGELCQDCSRWIGEGEGFTRSCYRCFYQYVTPSKNKRKKALSISEKSLSEIFNHLKKEKK